MDVRKKLIGLLKTSQTRNGYTEFGIAPAAIGIKKYNKTIKSC